MLDTDLPCRESSRGVVANALNSNIGVSEFELQSRYYVHLRTNTLGKGMNTINLPAVGEMVPLLFCYKCCIVTTI